MNFWLWTDKSVRDIPIERVSPASKDATYVKSISNTYTIMKKQVQKCCLDTIDRFGGKNLLVDYRIISSERFLPQVMLDTWTSLRRFMKLNPFFNNCCERPLYARLQQAKVDSIKEDGPTLPTSQGHSDIGSMKNFVGNDTGSKKNFSWKCNRLLFERRYYQAKRKDIEMVSRTRAQWIFYMGVQAQELGKCIATAEYIRAIGNNEKTGRHPITSLMRAEQLMAQDMTLSESKAGVVSKENMKLEVLERWRLCLWMLSFGLNRPIWYVPWCHWIACRYIKQ